MIGPTQLFHFKSTAHLYFRKCFLPFGVLNVTSFSRFNSHKIDVFNVRPLTIGISGNLATFCNCFGLSCSKLSQRRAFSSANTIANHDLITSDTPKEPPSSKSNEQNTTTSKNVRWADKFKKIYKEYGKYGLATYFTISTSIFTGVYVLLSKGINIDGLLQWIGISPANYKSGGVLVLAVGISKLLFPFKVALTLFLTPKVKRFLKR